MRPQGTAVGMPAWLARLAEAYGQVGQVDEGVHLLAEALAVVDTTGERGNEAEYRAPAMWHGANVAPCEGISILHRERPRSNAR